MRQNGRPGKAGKLRFGLIKHAGRAHKNRQASIRWSHGRLRNSNGNFVLARRGSCSGVLDASPGLDVGLPAYPQANSAPSLSAVGEGGDKRWGPKRAYANLMRPQSRLTATNSWPHQAIFDCLDGPVLWPIGVIGWTTWDYVFIGRNGKIQLLGNRSAKLICTAADTSGRTAPAKSPTSH